jgi:prophage antirepressor-like protein
MNNSIISPIANPFNFDSNAVRTAIDEIENVWFCAKDICAILDITWSGATLENMNEEWVTMLKLNTVTGEKDANFINESGLYWLIFRSNKPRAKEFANWVLSEVLPQIRKHGYFGILPTKDYLAVIKQIMALTELLTESKNAFTHQLLIKPLQNLCNIAGHAMPDIKNLSLKIDQIDLFIGSDKGSDQ